jgi:hypothetical protein
MLLHTACPTSGSRAKKTPPEVAVLGVAGGDLERHLLAAAGYPERDVRIL